MVPASVHVSSDWLRFGCQNRNAAKLTSTVSILSHSRHTVNNYIELFLCPFMLSLYVCSIASCNDRPAPKIR